MTTQQNDTAALTDEQLEGVAGGSTSVDNLTPHPSLFGSSHKCMHDLARSRSSTPGEEAADVLVAGIQRGSRLSLSRRPPARPRSWWGACSAAASSTARC